MDDRDEIQTLLSRVALRDAVALESLYRKVAARLLAVASRVVQDRALAEDVLQEVFLTVWNQSAQRAPGQSLTLAWLCVVTRNRAIDMLRRKKPEQPLVWHDDSGEAQMHDIQDDTGSPLDQLLAHEDGQRLGHCLGALEQGDIFRPHKIGYRTHRKPVQAHERGQHERIRRFRFSRRGKGPASPKRRKYGFRNEGPILLAELAVVSEVPRDCLVGGP